MKCNTSPCLSRFHFVGATFGPNEFIRNLKYLTCSTSVILILRKMFSHPSGKLSTEFTSPTAKSTSPGLSDTTFFARWTVKYRTFVDYDFWSVVSHSSSVVNSQIKWNEVSIVKNVTRSFQVVVATKAWFCIFSSLVAMIENPLKLGTHSLIKGCLQTEDRRPKTWKSIK